MMHLRKLFGLHRAIGVAAALLVVVLALSGLLLNHTEALRLDQRPIEFEPLLRWYGVTAPAAAPAYHAGGHWVARMERHVYFDQRELLDDAPGLVGAVAAGEVLAVALPDRLLLLDVRGEPIETLSAAHGLPVPLSALGLSEGRVVARGAGGEFIADAQLLGWVPLPSVPVHWSTPAALPEALYRELAQRYRGAGLSLERVLLDLHSGRLLGAWGVLLMDLAAIALLLLAASGLALWLRVRRLKARAKPRYAIMSAQAKQPNGEDRHDDEKPVERARGGRVSG